MKNGTERLTGRRIYLRRLDVSDATAAYAGWLNDPEVNRFLDTKSATLKSVQDYIQTKNQKDNVFLFGIFVKAGDHHIGTIKLDPIDYRAKKATMAVMVGDKAYWGKGLGREAIRLLTEYGFTALGLQEIWLGVQRANRAAITAYAKLGFTEVPISPTDDQLAFDPNIYNEVNMVLTHT